MELAVFGIRHHGPGSASALIKALEEFQPSIVLIEGPPDADNLIQYVENTELKPPIAILVYNPKNLSQASYYPFAEFSPEWQAMLYGVKEQIPVRFMDIPQSILFEQKNIEAAKQQMELPSKKSSTKKNLLQKDPLGYMAKLAGYEDSERWWEMTFEQDGSDAAIFPLITEMMRLLREDHQPPPSELLREAHMRKSIRKAQKEGFEKIAVVCGAWHSPVLEDVKQFKISTDNAILRGLKKVKTKSSWIPWTYKRLARQSGYGAGVISPAWYETLFRDKKNTVAQWMTTAARLFRKEGMAASSANVIESVRLAETLAALRNLAIPGIEELSEAATTVLGEGHTERLELIKEKLIIGDVIGHVPNDIPILPLQEDIDKSIKSARLTKERNTSEAIEKKLDLRKNTNLAASHLLHRMLLLNIPWGTELAASKFQTGSFNEHWRLYWQAEFAISIIEAGMWGNTVVEASTNYVNKIAQESDQLPKITQLIGQTLKAHLPNCIPVLIDKMRDLAAITKDIYRLMEALPSLVDVLRYGSTRKMDILVIEEVVNELIPRISIGLPNACVSIDEEVATDILQQIKRVHRAIYILNDDNHIQSWISCLKLLVDNHQVHPLLQGNSCRILFDKTLSSINEVSQQMAFALSNGNDRANAAYWLEGFLDGSGLLLIHYEKLWQVVDDWVSQLEMDNFMETLPLLRRSFSKFSEPERQKMMQLIAQVVPKTEKTEDEVALKKIDVGYDEKRAKQVLATLEMLLCN